MFKKFNQKLKKKGGFTLIELIIVIAILAILALIAVPRFSSVQTDAQSSANQATARTILSAASMAEAKYSTNNFTEAQVTSINEFLNEPIVLSVASAAPASTTNWVLLKYNGAADTTFDGIAAKKGEYHVFYKGKCIK